MNCPFCTLPADKYLVENQHFVAIRDIRPVTKGHCLIVAKRHAGDFFELSPEEMEALHALAGELKRILDEELQADGYNLLMNCGRAAGQSVFHFHMHMIPRLHKNKNPLKGLREFVQ